MAAVFLTVFKMRESKGSTDALIEFFDSMNVKGNRPKARDGYANPINRLRAANRIA